MEAKEEAVFMSCPNFVLFYSLPYSHRLTDRTALLLSLSLSLSSESTIIVKRILGAKMKQMKQLKEDTFCSSEWNCQREKKEGNKRVVLRRREQNCIKFTIDSLFRFFLVS